MSDPRENGVPPGALQVEHDAADWLVQQRDMGAWNSEAQIAFETWLQASLSHRITYLRLKSAWENADRLSALRSVSAMRLRPSQQMRFVQPRIVAAVVMAVLVGAAVFSALTLRPADRTFSTSVGGHKIITLADNTRIELNTDTSIRTRVTTAERTVWLDKGEAFFAVQHDATHPFVVIAGNRRITDLGTEFSIRRERDRLKVALFSGRAYLDQTNAPGSGSSALLKPGDVAVATHSGLTVNRETSRTLVESLGWRNGTVVFNHTALADVAAEFNRYSDHKLAVSDPSVGRITIGGTFDVRNVEAFADIVKHAIGLHIEERNGKTVISR